MINAGGKSKWTAGVAYNVDGPVEPKPALLSLERRLGKLPLQIKSIFRRSAEDSEGNDGSLTREIVARLNEDTQSVAPGGAKVQLGVERFAVIDKVNGKTKPPVGA